MQSSIDELNKKNPNLENTCVSSCSVQAGPKLATNIVGHGGADEFL